MRLNNRHIIPIIILFFIVSGSGAQNTMSIGDYEAEYNDTVTVSIGIDNTDSFVSFQCDVTFDDGLTFVDGSASLTDRKSDHLLIASMPAQGRLRFLSYSNSNATFNSNTGPVMTFKVATNEKPGNHALVLQDAIIGNVNSQNILTGTMDGNIHIPGLSIHENSQPLQCKIYPNPVTDRSVIRFNTQEDLTMNYQLVNCKGQVLARGVLDLQGTSKLSISELFCPGEFPPGIYMLIMSNTAGNVGSTLKVAVVK